MHFAEKKIELKDGRKGILRAAQPEDAWDMIACLQTVFGETPFLLRNADEVNFTEEEERRFLQEMLDAKRELMMLVQIEEELVGNCSVMSKGEQRRIHHRCGFAIALKKEYWHLGLGTLMMEYALELAEKIGYEQMELEVTEGNDRAKALYEKLGFEVMRKMPKALKYDDGSYKDEYVMIKIFHDKQKKQAEEKETGNE